MLYGQIVTFEHWRHVDLCYRAIPGYIYEMLIIQVRLWIAHNFFMPSSHRAERDEVWADRQRRFARDRKTFYIFMSCLLTNKVWDFGLRCSSHPNRRCSCPFTREYDFYWEQCGLTEYMNFMGMTCNHNYTLRDSERIINNQVHPDGTYLNRMVYECSYENPEDLYLHCRYDCGGSEQIWFHGIIVLLKEFYQNNQV